MITPYRQSQVRFAVIQLGKECAVSITGDPADADTITDWKTGLEAIKAALKLGIERNNELNELRMSLREKKT